jgi:hypothetical protein
MVGQLAVVAANPQRGLDDFVDEVRTTFAAFREAWPGTIQLLQRDTAMHYLYDDASGQAFKFLWEERLHRPEGEQLTLGHRVRGGGLRLVMPPEDASSDPNIEAHVESFLADPRKLFVSVQMVWVGPRPTDDFHPDVLLQQADTYAKTELVEFIKGN